MFGERLECEVSSKALVKSFKQRFEDYNNDVFSKMRWMDPQFWSDEPNYGNDEMATLATHFQDPLPLIAFDEIIVLQELNKFPSAKNVWKADLTCGCDEFPNLCKMASLVLLISCSNFKVERTFSTVSNILSDKCLSISHSTLNNNLMVYGNNSLGVKMKRKKSSRKL